MEYRRLKRSLLLSGGAKSSASCWPRLGLLVPLFLAARWTRLRLEYVRGVTDAQNRAGQVLDEWPPMFARKKVFVSYSTKNTHFVKQNILPAIKRANRESWFAPRSIGGGDDWRAKLLEGLQRCDRLLVTASIESQKSKYVKDELAAVTKPLLERRGKLDARQIHRAILPVVIEERGPYGEKATHDPVDGHPEKARETVDPYLLHPYLTLVNFITFPYNKQLDEQLSAKGGFLGDKKTLTKEQQRSVETYTREREEARHRLVTAIRSPEALRWNFRSLGKVVSCLTNSTLQRAALAAGTILSTFLVLAALQERTTVPAPSGENYEIAAIDVLANGRGLSADQSGGFPVDVSNGPVNLQFRVRTTDGDQQDALIKLQAEKRAPERASLRIQPSDLVEGEDVLDFVVEREKPTLLRIDAITKDTVGDTQFVRLRTANLEPLQLDIKSDPPDAYERMDDTTDRIVPQNRDVMLTVLAQNGDGTTVQRKVVIPAKIDVDDLQVYGITMVNDRPQRRTESTAVQEASSWESVTTFDATDMAGMWIKVNLDDGQSFTRPLRFPTKAPAQPEPPTIWWNDAGRRWVKAGSHIPYEFGEQPSTLRLKATIDGTDQSTSTTVNFPGQTPAGSPPTIEIRSDRERWSRVDGEVIERTIEGSPYPLSIRATTNDQVTEARVVFYADLSQPRPPTISVMALDTRSRQEVHPRNRTTYQLSQSTSFVVTSSANGTQASKAFIVMPPQLEEPVLPQMPSIFSRVVSQRMRTLFIEVKHSRASRILINGRDALQAQKYDPIPGGYRIEYTVPNRRGSANPIVFSIESPEGITATTSVVPIVIPANGGAPKPGSRSVPNNRPGTRLSG